MKQVNLITCQFLFHYDNESNIFRIRNDGSRYTVSTLKWNYMKDYQVYDFKLKDHKYVDLKKKTEVELKGNVEYSFDVSQDGQYVRYLF